MALVVSSAADFAADEALPIAIPTAQ